MLFQGAGDSYDSLIEFSHHLGWFIVTLPTMFVYIYKRHIVNIFFHFGAMGLTYLSLVYFRCDCIHFSDVSDELPIVFAYIEISAIVFPMFGIIQIIPHSLFCIYATIYNYKYFKSLNIKDKFSLCVKSFFAGLALAFVCICIGWIILLADLSIDNGRAIKLEITLGILANILLLAYIIYKDIKAYLQKRKVDNVLQ